MFFRIFVFYITFFTPFVLKSYVQLDTASIIRKEGTNAVTEMTAVIVGEYGIKSINNAMFILPGRSMTPILPILELLENDLKATGTNWDVQNIPLSNFRYVSKPTADFKKKYYGDFPDNGDEIINNHFNEYIDITNLKKNPDIEVFIVDYSVSGYSSLAVATRTRDWLETKNLKNIVRVINFAHPNNIKNIDEDLFREKNVDFRNIPLDKTLADSIHASEFEQVASVIKYDVFKPPFYLDEENYDDDEIKEMIEGLKSRQKKKYNEYKQSTFPLCFD